MGLSRRFLNLIVNERMTSLCSIDLGCHELFFPPGTLPRPAASKLEQLTLPTPTMSFRASRLGCLPFADRKVLCTDKRQHAFLLDAAMPTPQVVTIPTRRVFKGMPVAVFVSSDGDSDGDDDPDGTLFVLETWPDHEKRRLGPETEQFEALVYRRTSKSSPAKSWHSQYLPPLPYLRNPKYWTFNVGIASYAIVGGGSHICVSLKPSYSLSNSDEREKIKMEIAGTYCLDTASHTWSKVGDWTLPFVGKVEYVPELKLWFGISDHGKRLAAADLSAMDSEPLLVGSWQVEADGIRTATAIKGCDWRLFRPEDTKLAYLGSGRFCIAMSFTELVKRATMASHLEIFPQRLAVLTGVAVTPRQVPAGGSRDDGAKAKLQMIRHKSWLLPDTSIDAVF